MDFFRHGLMSGIKGREGKGRMFHFPPGHSAGHGNSFILEYSRINGQSPFFLGTSALINSGIAFPDKSRDFIAHFHPTFGIPGAFPHFSPFPSGILPENSTPIPFQEQIPGKAWEWEFQGNFGMGERRFWAGKKGI